MRPKKANAPAPVLRLVQNQPSKDLIETLAWLLQEASAGRLTGIAYAAMFPQNKFVVQTEGEARRNPLYALGMVHVLADEMTRKMRPADE